MVEKIDGARLIGSTWYYWKRAPKRLVEAFGKEGLETRGAKVLKRETMGTKDPDKAKLLARAYLTKLDKMEAELDSVASRMKVYEDLSIAEQGRLVSEIAENLKALPTDQRQLVARAGGVFEAGASLRRQETLGAFLRAGRGAEYDLKDAMGEEYDPEERELEEAQEAAVVALHERKGKALRSALTAAKVVEPAANVAAGLRDIMDNFCTAKGYVHTKERQNKTRRQYEYSVRRFIEYHGDVPLAQLSRKHLADFATDFLRLPVSSRKDIRPLAFWDAVKIGEAEGLPCVSARTRDQNLTFLKALMTYAVNEGKRPAPDPWAGYSPITAREKVSARRKRKPHSFSRVEMRQIIAHVTKCRSHDTVDYWGPILGAHHGMRLEEVCQLRVADFTTEEGYACVGITDDSEDQTVKTENSYRIIPIHPKVIELGFMDYVERRRQAGAAILFMSQQRWGGEVFELYPDRDGRYGTHYGSRFRETDVKDRLGLKGYRIGFHSFRHGWTDLARNTGADGQPRIAYEHRLALAGRDAETGERILDGTERRYGHGFSIEVLARELAKINVLNA